MLWKIEYFVEGKNLEKALAGSAGIALNMSPPQPVTGAAIIKTGSVKKLQESGEASMKERFIEWVKAIPHGDRLTTKTMKEYYITLGSVGKTNVSPIIDTCIENGLIKRISQGQYSRL